METEFGTNLVYSVNTRYEWDPAVPGFGVRLNARAKTWVLKYRLLGKQHWANLGNASDMPVEEARALARRYRKLAKSGTDPFPETRRRSSIEFRAFAALYLERYARPQKRSWYKDEQTLRCHAIPAFGGKLLHEIKRADIAAVHHRLGQKHPYAANRLRELLHTMFKLARIWELLPDDHANPANGIADYKERKRSRWLTPEEVKRVAAAIESLESQAHKAILWIYLSAGLRRSEPLSLRWKDVDFDRGEIHIPQTKSDRPHCVPLPRFLIALIDSLPRVSQWVFPGAIPGHHFKRIDKVWTRVRIQAGLGSDVTLHCLRHTVGSWLAQAGVPLRLVGEVLNHADYKSTLVYAHFARDNVRDALEKHAKMLDELRDVPGKS